ncbi:PqqD family protein [Fusibacter sp. Q10-2]|uniref:PqqD family protein n=1 Tax=Fusibacter ferrireducens TaxID=2785058 RepID=A0ABR9ZQ32_9FIRM|nr:PqqD family protein [Fusibacter ferrireducens]
MKKTRRKLQLNKTAYEIIDLIDGSKTKAEITQYFIDKYKVSQKDSQYLLTVGILLVLSLYSINGLVSGKMSEVMSIYSYYLINFFNVSLMMGVLLTSTAISEKTSGRCEYYMANNISLSKIGKVFSNTTFVLVILPVLLLNIITYIVCYFVKESMIEVFFRSSTFHYLLILIIFAYFFSNFLVTLVLLLKDPQRMRTLLTLTTIILINAFSIPARFLFENGILQTATGTANAFIIIVLIITLVVILINKLMSKKLSVERVILSYRN